MRNMTARADAIARGDKTYVTGAPCKQGHLSPRATRTGTCIECTQIASKQWLAQRPGKCAEYTAAYRERNKAEVLDKDRARKAQLRKSVPEKLKAANKKSYAKRKLETTGVEYRPGGAVLRVHELMARLEEVHGGRLGFVGGYVNMQEPATFMCREHCTPLQAIPHNVLRGANPCHKCNHMASKGEGEVFRFLANLASAERRNRTLLKPKEVDIYLPEHRLAVEYCGEFFHSAKHADEESSMRTRHSQKHALCAMQGVRLITLWESEWRNNNYAVRRLLRNAVGKSKGKLMARKCELRKVDAVEAAAFYERYHPQGGSGHGEHYALFWKGKMVACMRFVQGVNDRGLGAKNRVWTLGRYATRITVAGAASRLFKAFVAEHNPPMVKSFSDNRLFGGAMYAQLGFELEAELSADYAVWSPKLGLRPKSHYQRRNIQKRLADHGMEAVFDAETDPRTEAEMTYLMRCGRLYDCGKKRWVWKPVDPA